MPSDARKSLRKAYEDTAQLIGRLVPSFFITCLSTIIFAGSDDRVLLSGGEVAHPLVGKTRYEIFMIIAPVAILVLRAYIDMQIAHLHRIEDIFRRVKTRHKIRLQQPVTLSAKNNRVLLVAGALAIHVMPPFAIAFLGRHASAAYPEYGLALYGLALVLAIWSGFTLYRRYEGRACWAAASFPVVMAVIGAASLHNSFLRDSFGIGGVFGASTACERRFEGALAHVASPFLRQINLEKENFKDSTLKRKNLSCGDLTDSTWQEADLRESVLWGADLRGAEFIAANISQANFDSAILRQAKLHEVIAFESQFFRADLERAEFAKAELQETRFVSAMLEEADFEDATLGHAKLYKAQLSDARFKAAEITDTEFVEAVLYDAEFLGARLANVDFYRAKLEGASFVGAELEDISFDEAEIMCTDFRS
ncbi:MAG: pentapeptide repeat-containing protein, partial [Pseudomonadota bacterium]